MTVAGNAIEYLQDSVLVCVGKTPLITLSRLFQSLMWRSSSNWSS
jgi:hypothetical protein